MGKRLYQIAILTLALVVVAGVVISGVILNDRINFEETVVIEQDGIQNKTLSFTPQKLFPGEISVCKLNIVSRANGDFEFLLDYVGLNEGTLNEFVQVAVCCDNQIGEYTLSDLITGSGVTFVATCKEGENKTVTVTYSIPSNVGNEAQGLQTNFETKLSIKMR